MRQHFQAVHDRRGIIAQRLPRHNSGEHHCDPDVQHRANHQRGNNPDGQIALRIARLLSRGGDGIEPDIGEEDNRAAGQNA